MPKPKKVSASLDFAFFQFLWQFYQVNRGTIRSHYKELTRKFLDFNNPDKNPKAFLRQPQFEALETYVFLKEFLGNSKVEEIFKEWYERTGKFEGRKFGSFLGTAGQEMFQFGESDELELNSYKVLFEKMRKNSRAYPNYIFALTMGTGKTILMATCIFYEFLLGNKFEKDPRYCHNALVFAPDKTVLQSLKEIEAFDLTRVVPPEYVNFLTAHLYDLDESQQTEEHEVDLIKIPPKGYYEVTAAKGKIVRRLDEHIKEEDRSKSFHLDTYCFDSGSENVLFWDLLREKRVKKIYFTGMLTHGQSDFFIQYIDPDSHTVRSYYPDFVFLREEPDGSVKYVIVEVKADNQIEDAVVQAKKDFANQIAVASGMEYRIIKSTDADSRNY